MNLASHLSPMIAAVLLSCACAHAQSAQPTQSSGTSSASADARGAPPPLVVLFESGSSALRAQDKMVLDRAARAYNDGKPLVMILTGTSDRVGPARSNLTLSERRAGAVLAGLLARGIPAERFQVLAKGESELPVATKPGVAEARDRSVAISWR